MIRAAPSLWRVLAVLGLSLSLPAVWVLLRHQGAVLLAAVLPIAAVATAATALPQWWLNHRLRRLADPLADYRATIDPATSEALRRQVLRSFPTALYVGLSGQLTTWLISIFGVAASVASVGALARLAALMSALGIGFGVFAVPRFARIPASAPSLVVGRFWQAQCALALVCCIPLGLVVAFPGAALATVGGAAYRLAAARGVVTPPWIVLPYSILIQVGLVLLLPLGSIRGVITLGLVCGASQWLLYNVYFLWTQRHVGANE